MSQALTYRFKTLRQSLRTIVPSVLALGAIGLGLAVFFSPAVAAVAGGLALLKIWRMAAALRPSVFENAAARGEVTRLPAHAPAMLIAQKLSTKMGFKTSPQIYVANKGLAETLVGRVGSGPQARAKWQERAAKYFGALPGTNIILTTAEALKCDAYPPGQLEFIIAHEMSHLKTDGVSFNSFAKIARKSALSIGVFAGVAAAIGIGVPTALGAAPALIAVFGLRLLTKAAVTYGERAKERRADRNALYVTRNLPDALGTMDSLTEPAARGYMGVVELFSSHPTYQPRMQALKKSFNVVSRYPAPTAPGAAAPAPKI